ncbi:MAG: DNA replication/repair protein RecF [Sphingosinicella sp.]
MISRLTLTDFRSYAAAEIEVRPGAIVLTGENGMGKTNILEAVSLFAPGRGLRQAAYAEMARRDGAGGFAVTVQLGDDVRLGTGLQPSAPARRRLLANGAPAAINDLTEWLSILWLTPAMDRLFADNPAGRRRFLDRLTLTLFAGHAGHSARYEAAMRARNKLLAEPAPDPDWLSALETRMEEHGRFIHEARTATVKALADHIVTQPPSLFPRPRMTLAGGAEAELARELAQGRERDAAAGRALAGPHRSDLAVFHEKGEPAARCSTGEQKAMLVSLVLAHAELVEQRMARAPILLLDEISAHLDPLRRQALFIRLTAHKGQVWMTGTERQAFAGIGSGACWLEVRDSQLFGS